MFFSRSRERELNKMKKAREASSKKATMSRKFHHWYVMDVHNEDECGNNAERLVFAVTSGFIMNFFCRSRLQEILFLFFVSFLFF